MNILYIFSSYGFENSDFLAKCSGGSDWAWWAGAAKRLKESEDLNRTSRPVNNKAQ